MTGEIVELPDPPAFAKEPAGARKRLTPDQRDEIIAAINAGDHPSDISRKLGTANTPTIYAIKRRLENRDTPSPRRSTSPSMQPSHSDLHTRIYLIGFAVISGEQPDQAEIAELKNLVDDAKKEFSRQFALTL
jgi:transposase-like protein